MRFEKAWVLSVICVMVLGVSVNADDLKVPTGEAAPEFTATATDGKEITLDSFKEADIVVVVFTCNSCPVAKAYEERLIKFVNDYKDKSVSLVAVNNSKHEDLEKMKEYAEEKGFNFTYAYEESGDSARDYGAKVTPHCFVLDQERKMAYQGAFDDKSRGEPTETYVADAVNALLEGKTVSVDYIKPSGCSIKFK